MEIHSGIVDIDLDAKQEETPDLNTLLNRTKNKLNEKDPEFDA